MPAGNRLSISDLIKTVCFCWDWNFQFANEKKLKRLREGRIICILMWVEWVGKKSFNVVFLKQGGQGKLQSEEFRIGWQLVNNLHGVGEICCMVLN
jgi:hypothetical protein